MTHKRQPCLLRADQWQTEKSFSLIWREAYSHSLLACLSKRFKSGVIVKVNLCALFFIRPLLHLHSNLYYVVVPMLFSSFFSQFLYVCNCVAHKSSPLPFFSFLYSIYPFQIVSTLCTLLFVCMRVFECNILLVDVFLFHSCNSVLVDSNCFVRL